MARELLTVVDAFTDVPSTGNPEAVPFTGNPAAVAIVGEFPSAKRMQLVAREIALSETAFVVPRADRDHDLRWFTPEVEVDLCGHATLASAHALGGSARFHTRSGVLTCTPGPDGSIEMDFPADPVTPVATPATLALTPSFCGRGRDDLLVVVDDAATVRDFTPDLGAIAALDCRGVIVTARADTAGMDFVSRAFYPAAGIPEDPVTGSAHCTLAGYWCRRLGRPELVGYQASARGGRVRVRHLGDRVLLGGHAVTVSEVRLLA